MDVDDLDRALDEAYRVLKPGGFLQFSILHPCFTAIGSQKYVMRTAIRSVAHRENISHLVLEKSNLGRLALPRMISRPGTQSLLPRAFTGQFQAGLTT
jgi:ubiquinone/menaquinone biosynthesis C-methylase UbiE